MTFHRLFLVCASACMLLSVSDAQTNKRAERYVGRAGSVFISEDEFLWRFEMLPAPNRHRKQQLEQQKLEFLYSMIAEKLLAQEALARKLDTSAFFQDQFNQIRKLFARDELYREEVTRKVAVTRQEISQGIRQAQKQLFVSFLYFPRKAEAEFVRTRIVGLSDFERLQIDSSMECARDTATVIWGDAKPSVEEAAYGLKVGEVSRVLQAGDGYYIVKLLRVQPNPYYGSMSPDIVRERVEAKIRLRKEEIRLNKFVRDFLKDKSGYSRPEPFELLATSLSETFAHQREDSVIRLTSEMVMQVKKKCSPLLNDTLAVAGTISWSLVQMIDMLFEKGFAVASAQTKNIPEQLNNQIKVWVQQELLAQEGMCRGLYRRPEVDRHLEIWRQSLLSMMMKRYAGELVSVSDDEVDAYIAFARARPLQDSSVARDTTLAGKKLKAASELLKMKQKRTLTLFLAQTGERRGFDVYQDRLMQLEITPAPMTTFRILGFGGKMFDLPFVETQLQWLDAEPPSGEVLP